MDFITEYLSTWAITHSDKLAVALIEDEVKQQFTYAELYSYTQAIAQHLQQKKLFNERVLILLPQNLSYVAAFFACLYAGAIAVPVYPPSRGNLAERVAMIAKDSQPKCVIAESSTIDELRSANFNNDSNLIYVDISEINAADAESLVNTPNEIAFLQYSSGSTGEPKGVILTHKNILANVKMIQDAFHQNQDSVFVSWLPVFHDMGLIASVISPVYLGATLYLMSSLSFIKKPIRWLRAISNYKATISYAPDFAFKLCAQISESEKEGLNLSSWQIAGSGAEPVRRKTIEDFCQAYSAYGFNSQIYCAGYGLAEATVFAACCPSPQRTKYYGGEGERKDIVSCGQSWGDEEIIIVNPETNAKCSVDEMGEIWISGSNVSSGYWQKPEINKEIFSAYTKENEGPYLRTGDLGFFKEDGDLYVTGRMKDLIIIHGKNFAAHDIEDTVRKAHPVLAEASSTAVAFSADHDNQERLIIALTVKNPDASQQVEIANLVKKYVYQAHDITPFKVLFVPKQMISKTTSGKLQRYKIKQAYLSSPNEMEDF